MRARGSLAPLGWPVDRLGDALGALAASAGLESKLLRAAAPADADEEALGRWLEDAASWMELEIEPALVPWSEIDAALRRAAPALVSLPGTNPHFLVLAEVRGRRAVLLGPDLGRRSISVKELGVQIAAPLAASAGSGLERPLDAAGVSGRRRERARALLAHDPDTQMPLRMWLLRPPPGASFLLQARRAGIPRMALRLVAAHGIQYALWILSWWMIGYGALSGRFDPGWLAAWVLVLLTLVPLSMVVTWYQGLLALGVGGLLRRRLLVGALRLDPLEIRHQGSGQLLGQVIESEAVESLAVSGGLLALLATLELGGAGAVLLVGAGGLFQALLLALWIGATLLVGRGYLRARAAWTSRRLELTTDLVERLAGHRTRLAQEPPGLWHAGEDEGHEQLLAAARDVDRTGALLLAAVPRGWLVVGLAGLVPAFVWGPPSAGRLAVALGGTLLAFGALHRLAYGMRHLAGALVAWRAVAPLFHAAARPRWLVPPGSGGSGERAGAPDAGPLVEVSELVFRYRPRGEPVLRGCTVRIGSGDRVLLEGSSGGGKSTLAALLAGLREPESGLILLGGLDRRTVGTDGWLRRVATAPQFHENHVLTGTLAFNLLMGRGWPPRSVDLEEAETVCRQLGLGELLEKMPGGLMQLVGETGWQLSHGERSRLYIARALLQGADLVILDESFAALDPENLRRCVSCALDRAPTLLVIAHP